MLTIYPALFLKDKNEENYTVIFPDIKGCITCGYSKEEAFSMAEEALGLMLYDMQDPPEASPLRKPAEADNPDGDFDLDQSFSSYVAVDLFEVEKEMNKKTVRKNVTIPQWLDTRAKAENINFSQTLQEALLEKLER